MHLFPSPIYPFHPAHTPLVLLEKHCCQKVTRLRQQQTKSTTTPLLPASRKKRPGHRYEGKLPHKNLPNPISTSTNHQPAVATPRDTADAFAAHRPMADDILGTDTLLQAPEADTSVMAGGDGFAAVLGEGEGGDGGGVREHVVRTLACSWNS